MNNEVTNSILKLYGRIFLEMDLRLLTGLRIGGSPQSLAIGALDNIVIRDPLTTRPYIPGSSLRGKMRSLWEKHTGLPQNQKIQDIRIHSLLKGATVEEYENDAVCRIFGVSGDVGVPNPTRLIVHDVLMSDEMAKDLNEKAKTDQPYTETKWEATIDRITSAAVPRQMERVPAGTIFANARLVYSVFGTTQGNLDDIGWFFDILEMLMLVEDDYLGSSGSRGSGRIRFENLRLSLRTHRDYRQIYDLAAEPNVGKLSEQAESMAEQIYGLITGEG